LLHAVGILHLILLELHKCWSGKHAFGRNSYKAVTSPLSFLGKENKAVITENNQKAVPLHAMVALRGRGDLAVSLSLSLS
jgi:hypothetical protein